MSAAAAMPMPAVPAPVAAEPQMAYSTGGVTYLTSPAAGQAVTYSAAPVTYSAAAPITTYAAAPVTYSAAPVTYSSTPMTYAGAPIGSTAGAPMEPAGATYVLPQAQAAPISYIAPQPGQTTYTLQGAGPTYAALQQAPSMVVVHGATGQPYFPTSVQAAWDNHFAAFGGQNLDKIMLDYDETSVVRLFVNGGDKTSEFRGMAQIRDMFAGLFAELTDLETLSAPVIDVEEEPRQVFLVWMCPGCGYKTATDTFIFGPDFKIKRQNIVVTKAAPSPATSEKVKSSKESKDVSSKKASKKKKNKGFC